MPLTFHSIHPIYMRKLLFRGALLWLIVRLTLLVLSLAMGPPMIVLSPVVAVIVVLGIAFLAQLDARAMRETLFHANLGTPALTPAVATLALAAAFELVIAVVAAAAT